MAKNENNLGFGHFSTAETEHDWLTRSYDGMESDGSDYPTTKVLLNMELEDLEKLIRQLADSRSFS